MKIFALAAIAGLALAAPATAQTSQIAVSYADLNLDSAEGRAVLQKRIERAAREVCGMDETQTTGTKVPSRSRMACYQKATSQIGDSIARAVERRENKG